MSLAECAYLLLVGVSIVFISAVIISLNDELTECSDYLKVLEERIEELDIRTDALDGIIQKIERK